jgi:hypothetical protein
MIGIEFLLGASLIRKRTSDECNLTTSPHAHC